MIKYIAGRDDDKWPLDKFQENLKEFLHNEVIEVHFTKKNGEDRVMKCTLMDEKIPGTYNKKIGNPPDEEFDELNAYMNVWSVDDNGWRSFLLRNVKYVKTNLND